MRSHARPARQTALAIFAIFVIFAAAPAAGQPARVSTALAVQEMARVSGAAPEVTFSPRTGLVSFLGTRPGGEIPVPPGTAEERARAFLLAHGAAFGLSSTGVEATLTRASEPDEVGMEHVRLRQTYRGVPVTGGEILVHLDARGVVAANAKTIAGLDGVATAPAIPAAEAALLAREELARVLGVTDATLSEPRLELLNRGLLGGGGFSTDLTWFVEARRIDLREFLWVDALHGKIVLRFSQLAHARNRQIWDAASGSSFEPGAPARTEGGAATGDSDVDAAYDYSGHTYDYFAGHHGRDSYDGGGATLKSTVRYCPSGGPCPYANAFWNGERMVYGEGFSEADDVAAHELAHAVTEHTANLFYYMQSGALNESFSDIFGESVDLLNGAGTDTAGVRWQLGEDVPGFGAIRDMADPTVFGDPGKVSDPEFYCGDDYSLDGGGVHSNSGVPNRAYSLMVDGDTYNGQVVSGIGLVKAGKIQYRALSRYLLSASDFLDNDAALRQSCQDLVGTGGITAGDCQQVEKALDAVEMSDPWPCAPTQASVPAFCPGGETPELWYSEDFEDTVVGVPDCLSGGVSSHWCVNQSSSLLGAFATSGDRSLWGYDQGTAGTMWFWRNFVEMPPANARLQFNHSHGFDNAGSSYYDGGHVVVSTDGGEVFDNAGPLIASGQAYGGVLSSSYGNPYGGLWAFVGDTWGYTATQLDLSSLSGTAFGYGFIVATDSSVVEYCWFVDDVRIYTCPSCPASRTLDASYNGVASLYEAAGEISAGDGFTVRGTEHVTLDAGGAVVLTDGFRAEGDLTVIAGSATCP